MHLLHIIYFFPSTSLVFISSHWATGTDGTVTGPCFYQSCQWQLEDCVHRPQPLDSINFYNGLSTLFAYSIVFLKKTGLLQQYFNGNDVGHFAI